MSIYLTSSLPPSPSYSHLDLNPDFSGFESGFPPNSDCQNTNEYLHPTQSMNITAINEEWRVKKSKKSITKVEG